MKKKILYLRTDICGIPINIGGSIGHTLGVISSFKEKYKVYVVSSAMKAVLTEENDIVFNSLKVFNFFFFFTDRAPVLWRGYYLRWRLDCIISNISFFLQVLWYWKDQKFELIYQRYSALNCTGVLLSWYYQCSLILEYNGSEAYWFKPLSTAPWFERWFGFTKLSYWVEDLNLKKAFQIVAVSNALKDDLTNRGIDPKKILVNPNGVEEQTFSGAKLVKERITIREKYSLEESFVFGFIGTFGHWHGIPMLEKIIPIICEKYPEAKFLLIGDGGLKPSLEKTVQKYIGTGQVVLTGKIAQHLAPEYLAACDAYLCPTAPNADGTRFFGSPTKLFEYMSMAKPVIASDLEQLSDVISPAVCVDSATEIKDILIEEQVGLLVSPLDVQGFVKACELCLHMSKQERGKLGENAREKVIEQYTWKKHVERILERL